MRQLFYLLGNYDTLTPMENLYTKVLVIHLSISKKVKFEQGRCLKWSAHTVA